MSMSKAPDATISREVVLAIKFLAVDAVEKAKSGHPGLPMGAADIAFVLWSRHLRFDPTAPDWPDRDRFVLSAGHGCMLLYALLHLSGYDLPMAQLQQFRQWGSATPGHPEFGHTVGVEATTGPLGQGVGNAVGMALSAKMLAARFNDGDFRPITHRIFALASDGDLEEGVSGEASSMAGHLGLDNLIVIYDDNRITIEGSTALAFSEDVAQRYTGYGWHVEHADGHDHEAIARALDAAVAETNRPSIVICRTHIANGAPHKHDTHEAHGSPLGPEETKAAKLAADWPLDPAFYVPDSVRDFFRARAAEGAALRTGWESRFAQWRTTDPERAARWDAIVERKVPSDIIDRLVVEAPSGAAATREHGRDVLNVAATLIPSLIGGSADLAPSTLTTIEGTTSVATGDFQGRVLHFGIREHSMGAIINGILYSGAFRPFGATFLQFSDYMRPAIRLAALSKLPAIYVFTHDSIFLGEDGPTHQPIEHLGALRLIPNLHVFRPADGTETALAWGHALSSTDGPTAIILTRQKLPVIERPQGFDLAAARRGAYRVAGDGKGAAVIAATGSEVHLAIGARAALAKEGTALDVVSMPCVELFEAQNDAFKSALFPEGTPVATIEAGRTTTWKALAGRRGLTLGIDHYGASAPASVLAEKFGFTVDAVTSAIRAWLAAK